jgi:hypothetical protein
MEVALFGKTMMDSKMESVVLSALQEGCRVYISFVNETLKGSCGYDGGGDFRGMIARDGEISFGISTGWESTVA